MLSPSCLQDIQVKIFTRQLVIMWEFRGGNTLMSAHVIFISRCLYHHSLVRSVCREEGGTERHVEEAKFANFMQRKKAFPG